MPKVACPLVCVNTEDHDEPPLIVYVTLARPVLLVPNTTPTNVESWTISVTKLVGAEPKLLSRLLVHGQLEVAPAHSQTSVCVTADCVVCTATHRLDDGSIVIDGAAGPVPVVLTDVSDIVHDIEQPEENVPYLQRNVFPDART